MEDGRGLSGDVAVLVEGVDKPSCALVNAAEGGEGEKVQTEEDLGGQLGGEHVERAEGGRVNPTGCWVVSRGHRSRSANGALKFSR